MPKCRSPAGHLFFSLFGPYSHVAELPRRRNRSRSRRHHGNSGGAPLHARRRSGHRRDNEVFRHSGRHSGCTPRCAAESGQFDEVARSERLDGLFAQDGDALQSRARKSSEILCRVHEHHFAHEAEQRGGASREQETERESLLQGRGRGYAIEVSLGHGRP